MRFTQASKVASKINELILAHAHHNRTYNFSPEESRKRIDGVQKELELLFMEVE